MSKSVARAGRATTGRQIKLVLIPAEHGGWSFMLEPVVLGLLVAPSVAGLWLSVAVVAIFMVRQPLKLALTDRLARKRYPRTVLAERFALSFALVALGAFAVAVATARSPFWVPVALAVPIALLQAFYDMRRQSRETLAELAGAVAMGSAASAIAMSGGFPMGESLALWVILAARAVSSILYVRTRLRLERGGQADRTPSWVSHLVGLAAAALLALAGLAPWLAVILMLVLTVRAGLGLSAWRRRSRPPIIGLGETAYGLLTVLLVALGYALQM